MPNDTILDTPPAATTTPPAATTTPPAATTTPPAATTTTPPAATTTPPAATTALDDPAAKAGSTPATWPDNWRDLLAGDDEGGKKQLERMSSPADVMKAYREMVKKQGSGQLKTALPENATPEQLAQFRKENGIPETHDKYDLTLSDGLVVGEEDKPMVDNFLKDMHAANAPPALVKQALGFYYKNQQEQIKEMAIQDVARKTEAVRSLEAEWGGEYPQNVTLAKNLLIGQFGEETASALYFSRLPDGSLFGNNAAVLKGLVNMAKEVNPTATLIPGGGNQVAAIGDEIGKYQQMMRENPQEYYRDPKHANRFAQLIQAQEKLGQRA